MTKSGTNTDGKMGSTKKKKKGRSQTGKNTREDLTLSTVSAQTVPSSRLFQPTTVLEKKLYLKMARYRGGFNSIERVFFLVTICVTRIRKR